ncbi:MAG: molybdopterin-synthase adenylyltransferase MoeB [Candidatus Microbacterium stercoravium]
MSAPLVAAATELSAAELARYARQIVIPGVGLDAQRRLKAARVLVIGAGGLGSPVLLYLAAAGVGVIGIVDDDAVDASNLHRQVIHGTPSLGEAKTASAAARIRELNPHVTVREHRERLTADNAVDMVARYDLVVDGSDNFATRYLAADAAEIVDRPVVWGSIMRFEGQVSVFWASNGPSYRDLFPEPPVGPDALSCEQAGVFGVLPGQVGTAMATEAIKLITGMGETLLGRLAVLDALAGRWREFRLERDPDRAPVTQLGAPAADDGAPADTDGLSPADLDALLAARACREADFDLIDVREEDEYALDRIDGARLVPLSRIRSGAAGIPHDRDVVLVCQGGVRSVRLLASLREGGHARVRHLAGGMDAWRRAHADV